jgi:uncharacterized membrane protein YqaE (UPF0057 family)
LNIFITEFICKPSRVNGKKIPTMRKYVAIFFTTLLLAPLFNNVTATVIAPVRTAVTEPGPEELRTLAMKEFKSLSKKEKKVRLRQLRTELQTLATLKEQGYETDTNTLLLLILAILLPPLAVYLHQGEINTKFWITLILWLLGWAAFTFLAWLPLLVATIYAILVILGNV